MKVSFNQLLGLANRTEFSLANKEGRVQQADPPFADTTGIHIYSDLALPLKIAAGDDQDAVRLLQILQRYAEAAALLRSRTGTVILEVQGPRLHLFREEPVLTSRTVEDVVTACRAFHALATAAIKPVAGTTAFNIRMAADYGRAIMLRSAGEDVSESLISLGNPANRPAKRLARNVGDTGVPADHLAVNVNAFNGNQDREWWELFKLTAIDDVNEQLIQKQAAFSARRHEFASTFEIEAKEFEPNPKNPVTTPIRRKGFMLRADMDNFSPQVKEAMQKGDQAILQLVLKFHQIMQFPAAYKDTLPDGVSVLAFPWAGDCANLFLECEDYALERTHLPNTAALNWHKPQNNGKNWPSILADTRWIVAIAGGDEDQDHGSIVTGNVYADGRTFHIGAGWAWRRSLDAEQADGTRCQETVIQKEDYQGLDVPLQEPYREHPENPSLFSVAGLSGLELASNGQKQKATVSVAATVPFYNITLPKPRPYGGTTF